VTGRLASVLLVVALLAGCGADKPEPAQVGDSELSELEQLLDETEDLVSDVEDQLGVDPR